MPALAAIAEEQIVAQPCAEGAVVDPIPAHAAINQLANIGQIQIEMGFAVRPRSGDQLFGVIESVFELDESLRPDLENSGDDGRNQRRMQVFRSRGILMFSALDR